jgi:hypothetical protein
MQGVTDLASGNESCSDRGLKIGKNAGQKTAPVLCQGCKTSFLPEGKYYFYPLNKKSPGYEKKHSTDVYYFALAAGYTAGEEGDDN